MVANVSIAPLNLIPTTLIAILSLLGNSTGVCFQCKLFHFAEGPIFSETMYPLLHLVFKVSSNFMIDLLVAPITSRALPIEPPFFPKIIYGNVSCVVLIFAAPILSNALYNEFGYVSE